MYVRPRFSPGYGDFALSHQEKFLNAINATKLIGITLSEGGIMIPEKSVSAIMGLSKIDTKCHWRAVKPVVMPNANIEDKKEEYL